MKFISILFLIVVGVIFVISIINKIKYRNWKSVEGKIIGFVEENGVHYPVFSFTTIDGRSLEIRNNKLEKGVEEISVESAYTPDYALEFLKKELPIINIPIKYNPKDPEEFIPIWL